MSAASLADHTHHHELCTSSAPEDKEYAFEVATSSTRFGSGVTAEVGYDCANLGAKKVLLMTDSFLVDMLPVTTAQSSLRAANVNFETYSDVRVEPTDSSMKQAIAVAKNGDYDVILAVGGGSVMDTAKVANLYSTFPDAEFLDFVNAPIGKGLPVPGALKPLICVPTTSGTGSETTGTAIFDLESMGAKTGIASRMLRPMLGLIDPLNTASMSREVATASGFDVLCHALESYTAIPYQERSPRPTNPALRPAYQGSNPISDVWCLHALEIMQEYFFRSVEDDDDMEAKGWMALASSAAGTGFGSSGCHVPHGCSYALSGMAKSFGVMAPGYHGVDHPLLPHGISVVMTAPSVFKFTAVTDPGRHLKAAELLGADVSNAREPDAGLILADTIRVYMDRLGVPEGLKEFGFGTEHLDDLVKRTFPQQRVLGISPKTVMEEHLHTIFEESL